MHPTSLREAELLLIDWSGTASDDRLPVYEANSLMMERRNMPRFTFDEWILHTKSSASDFFSALDCADPPGMIESEYQEVYRQVREEMKIHPYAYPDAKPFLEYLRCLKKKVIVVSSHPEPHLRRESTEYGFDGLVSRFVGGARNKKVVIRQVLNGCPPHRAAYLGDTESDMTYAREAGVISVALGSGYHHPDRLRALKPDFFFNNLTEVHAYFVSR